LKTLGGKKIKETNSHWYLKAEYSEHTNAYMVHNLKFGFADEKAADDYNIWLDQLFENGTTDEAKEFIKVEEAREVRERIERAKKTIEKAEKQDYLPLNKDMRAYIRNYNNICNEGGEGFVPIFVSREEYEEAKQLVAECENTSART
jgi:hypothetical protein